MLLLHVNQMVSTTELIDAVWETDPPATARNQIQICISALRSRLGELGGGDLIATGSDGYQLQLGGHRLDSQEFETGRKRAVPGVTNRWLTTGPHDKTHASNAFSASVLDAKTSS
jgi:DNA-binding SARP family transcriptional activator